MRARCVAAVCGLAWVLGLAGCAGGSGSGGGSNGGPKPPVANAGGPYTGTAGTAIPFSGAGSNDPQGQTLTYAWNFGDNSTGTGVSPSHAYSAAGPYTVSLTVTDTSGLTGSATSSATVLGHPTANAGGPYSAAVGVAISFSGAASSDPQRQTLTYAWNFGDNTTGTGVNPSHAYAAAGSYTVSLTVTDTSGLTGTATGTATVLTPPAANAGGPYTGTVGSALIVNGSASRDPQGQTLTYAWNFGDNSTGAGMGAIHIYSAPGTYTVTLTVTDTSNLSNSATTTATIAAAPPVANAGGPYTGTAGTAVSFTGAASHDPQAEALSYAWNFGDSTTGTGVSPSHTYSSAGTYTISLTVTNTSNLSNTATSTATIGWPPGLTGLVTSGTTPVVGAHVYLLAASATGYGGTGLAASSSNASVSLENAAKTGASDSVGAYVTTNASGAFGLGGDYTCSPGQQVYLYVLGGNDGSGVNAAIGLMAAVGGCPGAGTFPAGTYAVVNEVSTIAAAYAFAGFATDATHVGSSGTAQALLGIANAFAGAPNLAPLATGAAGGGFSEKGYYAIETLANILASCSGAGTGCSTLLGTATADGTATGVQPTDTANAAINIAHHPGANVSTLFALVGNSPPYVSGFGGMPSDWTITVYFTGGGAYSAHEVAIDGMGDVWVTNMCDSSIPCNVSEFSGTGAALSPVTGYTGGALSLPYGIAIDPSGDAWIVSEQFNVGPGFITELSPSGTVLSGASGFTGGGVDLPTRIAINGSGNVWVSNVNSGCGTFNAEGVLAAGSATELSSSGTSLSGSNGFACSYVDHPLGIAIDQSSNVWITNYGGYPGPPVANRVTKLDSNGNPVSPFGGYTGGGLNAPMAVAIDAGGNAWVVNGGANSISELSNSGQALSSATGFTGGGLWYPTDVSIDGAGDVWVANSNGNLTEFSNAGAVLSPATGYQGLGSAVGQGIAIDASGNLWRPYNYGVLEFVGIAAPVVTPLVVGVKNGTLGTRP